MSTVTTSTNVAIIQRNSSGDNAWVNVLGSTNANKALGFSSVGAVTALSVPLLASANTFTAANTFSALQTVAVTSAASGADLLYLGRSGETTDGTNQQVRFIAGNGPAEGNGFLFGHYSRTSGAQTAKNYQRFYDTGISFESAGLDKILDINTTLQTISISGAVHTEAFAKVHIGGTFLTSLYNDVRSVRVSSVAELGPGWSFCNYDAQGITTGTQNNDHIAGFQSRPRHECSGTLNNYYAFVSIPVTSGGLTTNVYGFYAFDTTGSTRPTNQYGLYVAPLSKGLTTNLAVYTAGTTPSLFGGNITARAFIGTDAAIAAAAIDWATGASFTKTLSASTTFTFANSLPGQEIRVAITNTASNYTVAWPASPTLKWSGGSAPTQTIGAKTDVYTFVNIGGVIYGSVVQNY
jgi:hypothetical protein